MKGNETQSQCVERKVKEDEHKGGSGPGDGRSEGDRPTRPGVGGVSIEEEWEG